MASLSGILFVVSDMPLPAEGDCLYIPQTEYGSGLAFIVSGRRKAVKALYKACKRFYDISSARNSEMRFERHKIGLRRLFEACGYRIQFSPLCPPAGNYPAARI